MKLEIEKRDSAWKTKLFVAAILELFLLIVCYYNALSLKIVIINFLLYITCANIRINVSIQNRIPFCVITTLILGFICLNLSQLIMNENISKIDLISILMSVMLYCIGVLVLYSLCLNYSIANTLVLVWILGITTINYYVFQFRGCELTAHDILSIRTVINVADEYKISLVGPLIYSWGIAVVIFYALFFSVEFEDIKYRKRVRRIRSSVLVIGLIAVFVCLTNGMTMLSYSKCGTVYNGFYLNFALSLKEGYVKKPKNYSNIQISELEGRVLEAKNIDSQKNDYPNVIVIMNESFADLSVLGEFPESKNVLSYYNSLNDDIIKGYALTSVYGGGTPNSEYEFLTGNTMGFLPTGAIAYQQYVKGKTYSLVEQFEALGYYSISMHPYFESGWMRTTVYPLLGFDARFFIQDFPQEKLIRDYVSDEEMYEQIIKQYESAKYSKPLFLFGVTMQNHGGYDYEGNDFENTVFLSEMSREYLDVEQYLSLIRASDEALKKLIEYFKIVDEDTVIMFYGDHQPNLNKDFLEEIHGGSFDTLDEQELMYQVPFFIWANYDIQERNVELTSVNYLSNYLFEATGIELPSYNKILLDIQELVPAVNSQGYYSISKGHFQSYEEAEGNEAEILDEYRILQYNSIFDEENHSNVFFPLERNK